MLSSADVPAITAISRKTNLVADRKSGIVAENGASDCSGENKPDIEYLGRSSEHCGRDEGRLVRHWNVQGDRARDRQIAIGCDPVRNIAMHDQCVSLSQLRRRRLRGVAAAHAA